MITKEMEVVVDILCRYSGIYILFDNMLDLPTYSLILTY